MKLYPLMTVSLLVLSTAAAASSDFYLLGEVTRSRNTLDNSTFDSDLTGVGGTGISSSDKKGSNQVRLQLGYSVNPNFAVEAGYIDFGKAKYSASYSGGTADGTLKAGGIDVAALGILPLSDSFSLFGKAGLVAARVKSSLSSSLVNSSDKATVVRPLLGVGATYKLNESLDLRAEYEHVSGLGKSATTGKMTDNMLSLGMAYHF
jgi:OOP family OmpA-OmpF porin